MTLDERIDVLQAAKRGKQIQCRPHGGKEWYDDDEPVWNFAGCDYRVAPTELWRNEYEDGHVSYHDSKHSADLLKLPGRVRCRQFVEVVNDD